MRRYENVEREIVTERRCVVLTCDMCARRAENPNAGAMPFEFGGVGAAGAEITSRISIDGEYDEERVDLCHDCAEWLIEQIQHGGIRRA